MIEGRRQKYYLIVSWAFLLKLLNCFGFSAHFFHFMKKCLTPSKFSILINGKPCGFFSSSKGLRQEDSLSPGLFILGMEVFSHLLDWYVHQGRIN